MDTMSPADDMLHEDVDEAEDIDETLESPVVVREGVITRLEPLFNSGTGPTYLAGLP
jgi:hypothetical protein